MASGTHSRTRDGDHTSDKTGTDLPGLDEFKLSDLRAPGSQNDRVPRRSRAAGTASRRVECRRSESTRAQ